MGTRHLTCVILDNEFKVAQYGQWDGYLGGQGADIMEFLSTVDRDSFLAALRECRFVTDAELTNTNIESHPELSRDTGAKILSLIQDGSARNLYDSSHFAAYSLFCEYAYILDCDNGYLEIYRGFNRGPLSPDERFFGYPTANAEYHPIKLWRKIPFADCNPKAIGHLQAEESHEYELSEQEE